MSHKSIKAFKYEDLIFDSPQMHPIELRDKLGLTNTQIAIALDVSIDTVKSWASRRRNPRKDTMILAHQRYSQLVSHS
ncbi:MAG: hypothetical protein ACOVQ7_10045 [Limnoraphis robusta]